MVRWHVMQRQVSFMDMDMDMGVLHGKCNNWVRVWGLRKISWAWTVLNIVLYCRVE